MSNRDAPNEGQRALIYLSPSAGWWVNPELRPGWEDHILGRIDRERAEAREAAALEQLRRKHAEDSEAGDARRARLVRTYRNRPDDPHEEVPDA
jgi:hypothetical protein